jgi:hypothetical protein
MNTYYIAEVGFSDLEGGLGNSIYQFLSAIVGVLLGAVIGGQHERAIRWLHALASVSFAGLATLCWLVRTRGSFGGAPVCASYVRARRHTLIYALSAQAVRAGCPTARVVHFTAM